MESLTRCTGPDPLKALCLIQNLGLYDTIFSYPLELGPDWANVPLNPAGNTLLSLTPDKFIPEFGQVLLRAEDQYHAWLLFALVPWAKVAPHNARHPKGKRLATAAAVVARDGIKAPNKAPNNIIDIVEQASRFVLEIQATINEPSNNSHVAEDSNGENQGHSPLRLLYGKAIRSWGAHWRLCVLYAFFVQIFESSSSSKYAQ